MTITRRYTLIAALLVAAVFAAGWFGLVNPKRTEAADLKEQTVAAEQQNATLQTKIKQLEAQAADLPAQQARLAEIRTQVPEAPQLPALIRSLTDVAGKSGVTLVSLTREEPTPVVEAAAATEPTTTEGEEGAAAESSTAEATATGTEEAAAPGEALVAIPLTVLVSGSYFDVEQFVNKAEDLTRAMLITGISIVPASEEDSATGELEATITAQVYMTQAQADAALAAS
jgi:Tfp pilus assembly protein PilO